MFLEQQNVTVHTVSELLWYLQLSPSDSPESVSSPSDSPKTTVAKSSHYKDLSPENVPIVMSEGDLSQPRPPPVISIDRPTPSIFALVIGINKYLDPGIDNLYGAVADADSIRDFLVQDLGIPQKQIKDLRNEEATRNAIETEIQKLSNNPAIEINSAILIFYAGHGAQTRAPKDWPARDGMIEMLLPHDFALDGSDDDRGQGVLDVKLRYLLEELASKKGNNITCIFDSCHSGSGTRSDEKNSSFVVRGIDLPQNYTIPLSMFSSNFISESSRASSIAKGSENFGLLSHVLLSACLPEQEAKEIQGSGVFTSALLKLLREYGVDKLTYEEVVDHLPVLYEQNPQCEGVNRHRILFNSKVPSPRRELYPVHRSVEKPDHFTLQAGEAHGIAMGAEFDIYADRNLTSFIGTVTVPEPPSCFNTFCTAKPGAEADSNSALLHFLEPAYALQTRLGELKAIRVLIPLEEDFLDLFRLIGSDIQKGDNVILPVDSKDDQPDLIISSHYSSESRSKVVQFEIMSQICRQHGLTSMPFDINLADLDSGERIHHILRSAAHFYRHLNRSPKSKLIDKATNILLECFKLKESEDIDSFDDVLTPDPDGENLNVGGVITIDVDEKEEEPFGYKITNNTSLNLYASLLYFDFSDLSIDPHFLPPTAKNDIIETPLPAKGCLTIGYGSSGTPPYGFSVRDRQDVDVGALKLFLSTDRVDHGAIAQKSPFEDHRGGKKRKPSKRSLWDSMTVIIVQRKKHV
ncbi:hypothetical protein K435DRAFT_864623 [Dendrothele bispora CBS 962.96]|uniref:Peptidase C14 caspase domain-containing protein n=1 Tax=Dendrothele bispora (strain CBS 962.96) TaxID=1314807 RepID=A0A4S8LLF4_DENBC|nr:hypothetical protein K435DRAFT_864623 [Dendrothele bispora CBS 962.96]